MPHLRIFRHYVHTPFLLMAALDAMILVGAAVLVHVVVREDGVADPRFALGWTAFAATMLIAMVAMGVYESRIREGYSAMMLRTAVALLFLGLIGLQLISAMLPAETIDFRVTLYAAGLALLLLAVWRWFTPRLLPDDLFKQRVIVLGTGYQASKIASRLRRQSDQRGFVLIGFLERDPNVPDDVLGEFRAKILRSDLPLLEFCERNRIDEIVVAIDERRRNQDAVGGIPLEELMDCRLSGINVCDVQQFVEREACKVDVDLLRPSWLVFSDGFVMSTGRRVTKRVFDVAASLVLLALFWPFMILVAGAILAEGGFRGPVLLRQQRVGLHGRAFELLKFRSMVVDAESEGPVWASYNEDRVTRVGNFIRKTHLDELPQLFNVLKGQMSFVGPRPERPIFVDQLNHALPFYSERHRVKPGITGWAQLCYPYGASVQDAKEKLQYDLYYLKNHSILLDLIILLQTVEVVLIGDGAR